MPTPAETSSEGAAKAASGTLSQLLARILSQLALSAWLPSAALVLMSAYIFRLGTVLDSHDEAVKAAGTSQQKVRPLSYLEAISAAFEGLGMINAAGIVLMISAVIVLTMLTQAFTFESIRFLEGYWVSWRPVERVAQIFCGYYRWRRRRIEKRRDILTAAAWSVAKRSIKNEQKALPYEKRVLTKEMIRALKVEVLHRGEPVRLKPSDEALLARVDWRHHAPVEILRRLANLDSRLDDYPSDAGTKPTRLGNVLKHYEEETGEDSVESIVDEVFDRLPPSLQLTHDEQRGRIDLYCSMTFVFLFTAVIAVARLGWNAHLAYAVGAIGVSVVGAWLAYRSAVASARYYGSVLIIISGYLVEAEDEEESVHTEKSWWRRMLKLAT